MKLKLCLKKWEYHDNKCKEVLYSFYINNNKIYFHNYNMNIEKSIGFYIKKEIFNLQNPLENLLAIIYSFYEVLNCVENSMGEILYNISISYNKEGIYLHGGEDMGDYTISGVLDRENEKIEFYCSEYQLGKDNIPPISNGYLNHSEISLLMQIYFGVYKEDELKNELEKNESEGKYEEVKKMMNSENWLKKYDDYKIYIKDYLSKQEVQEYLKLQLMTKDTSGAFDGLEIEKIYDKDRREEKQRKHIDEINKEFGEEVIVEE